MRNALAVLTSLLVVALAGSVCIAEDAVEVSPAEVPQVALGPDLETCESMSIGVSVVDFSKMSQAELDESLENFGGSRFTEVAGVPACPTLQTCPNPKNCFPTNCQFNDTGLQKCSSGPKMGLKCKPGTTIHIVSCQCLPRSGPPFPVCFIGFRDRKLVCQ